MEGFTQTSACHSTSDTHRALDRYLRLLLGQIKAGGSDGQRAGAAGQGQRGRRGQ